MKNKLSYVLTFVICCSFSAIAFGQQVYHWSDWKVAAGKISYREQARPYTIMMQLRNDGDSVADFDITVQVAGAEKPEKFHEHVAAHGGATVNLANNPTWPGHIESILIE